MDRVFPDVEFAQLDAEFAQLADELSLSRLRADGTSTRRVSSDIIGAAAATSAHGDGGCATVVAH